MWGENIVASIQEVIQTNPFLSYVANLERYGEKTKRIEPEVERKEEILLSREALEIDTIVEEDTEERPHDGNGERAKSYAELLEEIDSRVTELLTRLLMNQDYTQIVLEDFNKTRDLCLKSPSRPENAPLSRLSLIVLELLAEEERLPEEYRQAFKNLFQQYRALCNCSL